MSARLVKYSIKKNFTLEDPDLDTYKKESDLFEKDI
ncbi:hypothetical protein [Anaerococcus degeneri]|uniref:Uncharacterized protein n=1 Tax=Anaerococcus degeneri TaxID=361500 RepID=A0ABS7YYB3_9FIRM|nr:hypothetical protein [Anaerococcus degeneri]MCA2096707.1 hypothetical protein [Anaerococcus degeneri]